MDDIVIFFFNFVAQSMREKLQDLECYTFRLPLLQSVDLQAEKYVDITSDLH